MVQTPSGVVRRNRRHMKPLNQKFSPTSSPSDKVNSETEDKAPDLARPTEQPAKEVPLVNPDPGPDLSASPKRTRSGREVRMPARYRE